MGKMGILNILALIIFAVLFATAVSGKTKTVSLVNAVSNGFFLGPLKLATASGN